MRLPLDPPACAEKWGACKLIADVPHRCSRDERHQGRHRCECGAQALNRKKKKRKPKAPTKTQLRAKADDLFRDIIRARNVCEVLPYYPHRCNGYRQTMHIVSRKYLATRWSEDNALCGCSIHVFFTHNELEWRALIERMFPGRLEDLQVRALAGKDIKTDYEALIVRLQARHQEVMAQQELAL